MGLKPAGRPIPQWQCGKADASLFCRQAGPIPYGKAGIPRLIRLGDAITAGGETLVANYIYAEKCIEPKAEDGTAVCEQGHVDCIVIEQPDDYPMMDGRDRVWIYVRDCRPSE